ncbi:uncharacterized protein LOC124948706 isoform X2 [Vespa velutina]|uniref:uncharacterized protein LOC124948706 isoform X2 n=1 Tax=Vespa velutina TaxID=202808 RepID=UPI001FB2C45C|nr:uncharacterized protein LOC124948706 isoform X2 [Vespa velutina]
MWNRKVFVRIIEVLLCIACVVALRVTDDESRRVFHYLRNRSREWSLLNNVTWGTIGAALATATCGGYVIITAGLLIAAATNELTGRKTEIFFLGLGVILFGIVGALALASIESIPEDLIDNAAVLGALTLITALIFIADLLISPPRKKDKQEVRMDSDKTDSVKQPTMMTTEKEMKPSKEKESTKSKEESKEINGKINEGFEKIDDRRRKEIDEEDSDKPQRLEQLAYDNYRLERNRNFNNVERELREHTQNFENGRVLRNSQRYREAETLQGNSAANRSFDDDRRSEDLRIIYKTRDIYQRPIDEVDTPPFPTNFGRGNEPIFGKIINPSVKIMKIQHDVNEPLDSYRYSDTSQYDNVPVKMKGISSSILKKDRGVSLNGSLASKTHNKIDERSKNEIEMLEECFSSLRSTGTQTGVRTPSSPTDPGYVRHTASNWPHDLKAKTPGSSPEHNRNQ